MNIKEDTLLIGGIEWGTMVARTPGAVKIMCILLEEARWCSCGSHDLNHGQWRTVWESGFTQYDKVAR